MPNKNPLRNQKIFKRAAWTMSRLARIFTFRNNKNVGEHQEKYKWRRFVK